MSPNDGSSKTEIDNTGCYKNASNPHIARKPPDPRRAKGFGEIVNCNEEKDRLYVHTTLWKKGNNGDTTWAAVDGKSRSCTTCYHTGIGAVRVCENTRDNLFQTTVWAEVTNNGNVNNEIGYSRIVTLNCGGF